MKKIFNDMRKHTFFGNIKHTIESTYLCIKYPFLYPRNRFSDLHYTNWKLHDKLYGTGGLFNKNNDGLYDKAFLSSFIWLDTPDSDGSTFRHIFHVKNYRYAIEFYILKFIYEWIVPVFHCIPTYTEWDAIKLAGPGWAKAFGDKYLKEFGDAVKKLPRKARKDFRITQIKEKWGSLQVYTNYGSDEIYKIINKYEDLSYHTCVKCGKPATKLSGGYELPYCDDCFGDNWLLATIENDSWKYINNENDKD